MISIPSRLLLLHRSPAIMRRTSHSLSTGWVWLLWGQSSAAFQVSQQQPHHQQRSSRLFSTTSVEQELTATIQQAWTESETDGILRVAPELLDRHEVPDLLSASLAAVPTKGQASGIFNAWIGSCVQNDDALVGAERAQELLDLYDSDYFDLDPDLVTFSLAYSALCRVDDFAPLADDALERAQQLAKKAGGSKRRKSLATSSRKKQQRTMENEELRDEFGIDILHESKDLLVVNKPSGMVCFHKHTTTSGKPSRRRKNTTKDISLEAALLLAAVPLSGLNAEARGMVHRIDRGTSGLLVLAKTDEQHAQLVTDFFLRRVEKEYTALVELSNDDDIPEEGVLDGRIGGRPALSIYKVEESDTKTARLRIQTKTGRKHQIRIHCADGLKSPIVGDIKYNGQDDNNNTGNQSTKQPERFCLHASGLQIPDMPLIQAPVPDWWSESITKEQQ